MNEYFSGVIPQLRERVRHLISLIPRNLERDVDTLIVICRNRLDAVGQELQWLIESPELSLPENQATRVRLLRRTVSELDLLETVPIAALRRWGDEDRRMNQLLHRMAREISYPLPTPVVTCTSQNYYRTYPHLNLVCLPLGESRFLLHLPDLYHELAHPLLALTNDPKIQPFQQQCVTLLSTAQEYLAAELQNEQTGRGPEAFRSYLLTWLQCWQGWAVELLCDLFAAYVLGPAFAWSHFHLSATRGGDPCYVPTFSVTTHPPDAARMEAILYGLRLTGYDTEASTVSRWWDEYLRALGATISPEFRRCFPHGLLKSAATFALDGTRAIGCSLASAHKSGDIHDLLSEGWTHFWSSPGTYVAWESGAVDRLIGQQ